MSLPRPAATVIVVAPFKSLKISTNSFQTNYRIFMLKRSKESKFMGGAFVFPGGVADDADRNTTALRLSSVSSKYDDLQYRVCAIREAFEESGIAFFKNLNNFGSLSEWRTKIHSDAKEMASFCRHFQCSPAVDSLVPYARWITPIQEPKRYDTYFYIANSTPFLEMQGVDSIVHDGLETVNSKWFAPDEAIQEFEKGNISLAPPTWFILRHLAQFKSLDQLLYSLPADLPVPVTQPNIVKLSTEQQTAQKALFTANNLEGLKDPVIIALPGDSLHHDSPPNTTDLNRIEIGNSHGKLVYNHVCTVQHKNRPALTVPAKL